MKALDAGVHAGLLAGMAALCNAGHMHCVCITHGLQGVAQSRALHDLGHDYGERTREQLLEHGHHSADILP